MISDSIIQTLRVIEKEQSVRVLYACESGSRAWGFPSPDSDYDVRFIYVPPLEWYLSIASQRDVINRPISDALDLGGWDLRKTLQLYSKSNAPLLEWLGSPVVYLENGETAAKLRELIPRYFNPIHVYHHYRSMALKIYRLEWTSGPIRVKKLMYILRPLFACDWIVERKEMPPTGFLNILSGLSVETELRTEIENLIQEKVNLKEADTTRIPPNIRKWVEASVMNLDVSAVNLPRPPRQDLQELNELFRSNVLVSPK